MKERILGAKLARLQTIILTQTDKQRFIEKVKERYTGAQEIVVVDPTGIYFHYFPVFAGETAAEAMKKRPLTVSKKLVDDYNTAAQAALPEGAPALDLDSLETLTAHLDHWVDTTILKTDTVFTEDDLVQITAVYGKPSLGKFVYDYAKNGLLNPLALLQQRRFSNPRLDVAASLTSPVTVTSLSPLEVAAQIVTLINDDAVTDGSVPLLFADDIIIPVTHLKDGQTYSATVKDSALDYFGRIDFKVVLEEPVVATTLTTLVSGNTLTLQFNKPVEEIRFGGGAALAQTAEAPIGAPSLAYIFNASADLTTLSDALVNGLITAATLATSMVINFKDGFFDMIDFETLDTDFDGRLTLNLAVNTSAFTNLDNSAVTPVGSNAVTLLVQTDYSLTATEPHTPDDYTAATAQAVLTLAS